MENSVPETDSNLHMSVFKYTAQIAQHNCQIPPFNITVIYYDFEDSSIYLRHEDPSQLKDKALLQLVTKMGVLRQ